MINGEKTWVTNGGIADVYTLFARTGIGEGANGISAFVVFPHDPGFHVTECFEVMSGHRLATLSLRNCRIPQNRCLGGAGRGFHMAMEILALFRMSVAAAAIGFAQRAIFEAISHARQRHMFGATLIDMQLTQAALADMVTETETAALLAYHAAWRYDVQSKLVRREASMAKLAATESAQRVIDRTLQLFGARGLRKGEIIEELYRQIRALRIYEGASEVQRLVIARETVQRSK